MAEKDVVNNRSSVIKSNINEYVKSKVFYDGQNRPEFIYEAQNIAVTGTPCLKTTYSYVGASALVDYMKEEEASWDTSWETF